MFLKCFAGNLQGIAKKKRKQFFYQKSLKMEICRNLLITEEEQVEFKNGHIFKLRNKFERCLIIKYIFPKFPPYTGCTGESQIGNSMLILKQSNIVFLDHFTEKTYLFSCRGKYPGPFIGNNYHLFF